MTVSQEDNGPIIEFQSDGSQRFLSMKIVNLQSEGDDNGHTNKWWEEIGTWQIYPTKESNIDKGHGTKKKYTSNISHDQKFDNRLINLNYIILAFYNYIL